MRIINPERFATKMERMAKKVNLSFTQTQELHQILANPVQYISNPAFNDPQQMGYWIQKPIETAAGVPLDVESERVLFMQMNYALSKIREIQDKFHLASRWSKRDVLALLNWHDIQRSTRDRIITGNMGLVLSMAKRIHLDGVEFTDLVSEGSMALLRAVKGYDYGKGYKFSTYACRVILRRFSRIMKKQCAYIKAFPVSFDPEKESVNRLEYKRDHMLEDWAQEVRYVLRNNLAELTPTEQSVIDFRFFPDKVNAGKMTLKEVGEKLGLTKERIRQIQLRALAKLREITEQRGVAI